MEIRSLLQIVLQPLHSPPQGRTSKAADWLEKQCWLLNCLTLLTRRALTKYPPPSNFWILRYFLTNLNFIFCGHFEAFQSQATEELKAKSNDGITFALNEMSLELSSVVKLIDDDTPAGKGEDQALGLHPSAGDSQVWMLSKAPWLLLIPPLHVSPNQILLLRVSP